MRGLHARVGGERRVRQATVRARRRGVVAGLFVALLLAGNAQAAPADAGSGRFVPRDDLLEDTQTRLRWTQKDSGYAFDWFAAREYCGKRGAGWRLPTADELESVGGALRVQAKACTDCKADAPFRLGNGWVWSDNSNGISEAIGVNLLSGEQQVMYRTRRQRALCVAGT